MAKTKPRVSARCLGCDQYAELYCCEAGWLCVECVPASQILQYPEAQDPIWQARLQVLSENGNNHKKRRNAHA